MPQIRIDVSNDIFELLKKNGDYGFRHPAQFASMLILDGYEAFDPKKHKNLLKRARKYNEIGASATKMKGRKFSIANSVKDHNDTIAGYKQSLDMDWITEEEFDELVIESETEHMNNVRRELEKKKIDDKVSKKKEKEKKAKRRKLRRRKKPLELSWNDKIKKKYPDAREKDIDWAISYASSNKRNPLKVFEMYRRKKK